jgi:RNA-directed DNA polymerase
VVYADDLVRLHEDHALVQRCQDEVTTWRHTMGLPLKPSKTRITHTLDRGPEKPGCDFLGFHLQQYPAGKTTSGKECRGRLHGFKTSLTPSPPAIQRHVDALRKTLARHTHAEQERLIQARNPQIRGWSQYYAPVRSARLFQQRDHTLYAMRWGWAVHRHPHTAKHRSARKYWRVDDGQGWTFQPSKSRTRLLRHAHTPHRRDVKVQGTRSPYDGDWVYWSTRLGRHPAVKPQVARLLKQQQGTWKACGLHCTEDAPIAVDHILPKAQGGKETKDNLPLLHRHCHIRKTARDRGRDGTDDKRHVVEEPDDAKASRPVLKPSRGGDTPA